MSRMMENRAAGRAMEAATDAVRVIRARNYQMARELLQEALSHLERAEAQARADRNRSQR